MEDLGPAMSVVTEESPLTDEIWWYVLSGMVDRSGFGKESINGVRACKLMPKEREHSHIYENIAKPTVVLITYAAGTADRTFHGKYKLRSTPL